VNTRVDVLNRIVLTFLGLLLLGAGVLGLLAGAGAFGRTDAPVLPRGVRDFAHTSSWFWWAVAGGCLVIAVLALRWLLDQLRSDRASRLDLTTDDRDGLTLLHSGAFTDAVADEAGTLRGVSAAHAALHDRNGKRLLLTVDLADHADISEVRTRLEDQIVPHARQAVDDAGMPVDIRLRQGRGRSSDRGLR
jgi:hypothetical protein